MKVLIWFYFLCFLALVLVLLPDFVRLVRLGNRPDPFDEPELEHELERYPS